MKEEKYLWNELGMIYLELHNKLLKELVQKAKQQAKKEVFDDIENLASFKVGCIYPNSILDLKEKHLGEKPNTKKEK